MKGVECDVGAKATNSTASEAKGWPNIKHSFDRFPYVKCKLLLHIFGNNVIQNCLVVWIAHKLSPCKHFEVLAWKHR